MELPEENPKCDPARINHLNVVTRRMSQLFMSNNFADVVFIVEGQRLSAHKCILAVGNKYFEDLLYGELSDPKQEEFELKQVPLEAFRAILGYIYSGQMCLLDMEDHLLDILRLAQKYNLEELQRAIIKYLEKIMAVSNAWPIFELASLCDMEDLKNICYTFIDRNASNLLTHESFNELPKKILEDVLRRDSFLAPEFEIFTAVTCWCNHHKGVDVDSVLSYVRLPLMSLHELSKVGKSGILKEGRFIEALEMKTALKKVPYRVWPGRNIATLEFGAKIIRGSWTTDPPPPGNIFDQNGTHVIRAKIYEPIIVELGIASIINHIDIKLQKHETCPFLLEVSSDQSDWKTITDYGNFNCTLWQKLYFPPKFVKYIKIVGTQNTGLKMAALVASYEITMPKQVNGFIIATIEINGIIREGGIERKGALFVNERDYYGNPNVLFRDLSQPYLISSMSIFFSDSLPYDYSIEVLVNQKDWCTVVSKQNVHATYWQTVSFLPLPVHAVKISCSHRIRNPYDFKLDFETVNDGDGDNSKINE